MWNPPPLFPAPSSSVCDRRRIPSGRINYGFVSQLRAYERLPHVSHMRIPQEELFEIFPELVPPRAVLEDLGKPLDLQYTRMGQYGNLPEPITQLEMNAHLGYGTGGGAHACVCAIASPPPSYLFVSYAGLASFVDGPTPSLNVLEDTGEEEGGGRGRSVSPIKSPSKGGAAETKSPEGGPLAGPGACLNRVAVAGACVPVCGLAVTRVGLAAQLPLSAAPPWP